MPVTSSVTFNHKYGFIETWEPYWAARPDEEGLSQGCAKVLAQCQIIDAFILVASALGHEASIIGDKESVCGEGESAETLRNILQKRLLASIKGGEGDE